jgi:methionyl-tRNA formyltransferase
MIKTIITENQRPKEQVGEPTLFKRRKPSQSKITNEKLTLGDIFNHIRMLDAESYPKAFLESNGFRYEISRPTIKTEEILADLRITKIEENGND